MNEIWRIISGLLARFGALPWRAAIRRGAIFLRRLRRLGLVLLLRTLRLSAWALRHAVWLGSRLGGRVVRLAARLAARYPRQTLAVAAASSLAVTLVLVLRSEAPTPVDLAQSLDCLALNIYHEARGEPLEGKIAVGQVVMNRVADPDFPSRVCDVIKQRDERAIARCQFSWWCDGHSDRPADHDAWKASRGLARQILDGALKDPTGGALWYHADYVSPVWKMEIVRQGQIGRHVFYAKQSR